MPTPAEVVSTFEKRITTTLALHDELILAVNQKKRQRSLETMLAEQCVLGLAVLWEAFVHDLFVAFIVARPETCMRFHRDKITQSIEAKGKPLIKWVRITLPPSLSRDQIELLVDPDGWNITARSAEDLAKRANQLLSAAHAKKFSLPVPDRAFLDLITAIRNYLSHRSSGSLTATKQRLRDLAIADAASPLNGNMTTIGAYLKERPGTAVHSRAKLIGHMLSGLSSKLI
jgi:hypothetical protein